MAHNTQNMWRFRIFLKSLGPGEAGFVNACIGMTAFSFAYYQHKLEVEEQKEREFEQDLNRILKTIYDVKPSALLQKIKRNRQRIRIEAENAGLQNATRDELCDEWLRRRNIGEQEAENVDLYRLEVKSLMRAVSSFLKHYPDTQERLGQRRNAFFQGHGEVPLSKLKVEKILMFLEPLDKATCRNHPHCQWEKNKDEFYDFFRDWYGIPRDWPSVDQNEDDFSDHSLPENHEDFIRISSQIPPTRVAQRMEKLEQIFMRQGRQPR